MTLRDRDLISIQEARELVARASAAQKIFAAFSQAQVDAIVDACAEAATASGEQLARLAVEETGYGNVPDKILKNRLASVHVHNAIRGMKTVGILRFNIWMPVLSPQFDAAMDSLRDVDAMIIDVRGNFGGVGGMSMGIAGHFLDSALTIGTMHQRGAALKFVANPRRVDTKGHSVRPFAGPLALLVDELSISTTEIFAGGLQQLGRARVFGVQTSGPALPSVPERLPNGDILYHAIADFTSPTGKPVEGDGVKPDVVAPITLKALREGKDPARDAALAWAVQASKQTLKGSTP